MPAQRKMRVAPIYPLVLAEFRRNVRETVRVSIDEYDGAHAITIWTYWHFEPTEPPRPSKTGVTLGIQHLPALFDGLAKAMQEARSRGLIEVRA